MPKVRKGLTYAERIRRMLAEGASTFIDISEELNVDRGKVRNYLHALFLLGHVERRRVIPYRDRKINLWSLTARGRFMLKQAAKHAD